MTDKKVAIGVDLGGTRIKLGLVSPGGEIILDHNIATEAENGPNAVISNIIKGAKELIEKSKLNKKNLIGLGIGSPGSVDLDGGTVKYPPNFSNWTIVRLGEEVSKGLGNIKVEVDNDANVAAVGEGKFGAGKGAQNFFLLTLGTGIGGGIMINGKIHRGVTGAAGELGHTSIDFNGPQCNCGNKGCIEAYVGQKYLSKRTVEGLKANPNSKIFELINGDLEKVEPLIIYQAAKAGDEYAINVLNEAGFYLGVAAANYFNIFDFNLAIIGGGVSAARDLIFNSIIKTAKERVLPVLKDRIRIIPAALGNKAGLLGAAGLVL
jgi:glucokinase